MSWDYVEFKIAPDVKNFGMYIVAKKRRLRGGYKRK